MSPETEKDILAMFAQGLPLNEIIKRSGYRDSTIKRHMNRWGLRCYGAIYRANRQRQAYELHQAGMTWQQVANTLGYSFWSAAQNAASRYKKQEGIE